MEWDDASEAGEICGIESEDVAHSVDVHRCCQARIKHLNTQNTVLYNDPPPYPINAFTIWQETHSGLDGRYLAFRLGHRQAESIVGERAGHGVPKLSDVLVSIVKDRALRGKARERRVHQRVLRIAAPRHSQQDVGINETRRDRHLVVVLVEPLA